MTGFLVITWRALLFNVATSLGVSASDQQVAGHVFSLVFSANYFNKKWPLPYNYSSYYSAINHRLPDKIHFFLSTKLRAILRQIITCRKKYNFGYGKKI